MRQLTSALRVTGLALACVVLSGAVGLAVNALRPKGLPLVAPFPYEKDCAEKLEQAGPVVSAMAAHKLARQPRVGFVDARPEEDYQKQHLPGALSVPWGIAPLSADELKPLSRFAQLVVYCDTPKERLAHMQVQRLKQAGVRAAMSVLQGGMAAFLDAAKRTAAQRTSNQGAKAR